MIFVMLFGLCMGSFLGLATHRIPKKMQAQWQQEVVDFIKSSPLQESLKTAVADGLDPKTAPNLAYPASHCPACQTPLSWHDNIPLIGYLKQKGRCRHCQSSISKLYPMIEIMTASLSLLVISLFGLGQQGFLGLILTYYLILLSAIDYQTKLLPDRLTIPLALMGLTANAWGLFAPPKDAMLGLVVGFGLLYGIGWLYQIIYKKDGMGMGDAKLLGALGAWLGVWQLPLVVFLAALLGVLIHLKDKSAFAFGPYLALAGFISFCFGSDLVNYYLNFMAQGL